MCRLKVRPDVSSADEVYHDGESESSYISGVCSVHAHQSWRNRMRKGCEISSEISSEI
jgi:hypothetical protein